jgi:hypothetical protein
MSGGHFDIYINFQLEEIASEIQKLIDNNEDKTLDEWGYQKGRHYPKEVIDKFKETVFTLRRAAGMFHCVDYLVSGDYGPESFLEAWNEKVLSIKQNPDQIERP